MKTLTMIIVLCVLAAAASAQGQTTGSICIPTPPNCGLVGCPPPGNGMGQANYQRTPPSARPQQPPMIIGGQPTGTSGMPFIGGPTSPSAIPLPSVTAPAAAPPAVPPIAAPTMPTVVPGPGTSGTPPVTMPGTIVPSAPYIPGNIQRFPAPVAPSGPGIVSPPIIGAPSMTTPGRY